MDKSVDVTKRKPRQTRGTPAYKAANRAAFGIIAGGVLIGVAFR